MKAMIPPVDRKALRQELTKERFVRRTNNGDNEIYIVSDVDSPVTMQEIGRLRELSFRDSGGGTGMAVDIDDYDLGENGFKQLIVWNPEDQAIMGGYRFILCKNLDIGANGQVKTPTAKLFHYSPQFVKDFIPWTIELGRSFVQPDYQPSKNLRKGMYALDNLWDGLGALIVDYPEVKYFFGKVTMYRHFDAFARDLILYFMKLYFPDPDNLVYPHDPLSYKTDLNRLKQVFKGTDYAGDYRILVQQVRQQGENIPPLVNAYMALSATMRTFGTAWNKSFGDVEETGIIVTINDIFPEKKDRHTTVKQ
jgi:hypothetical protein